MTKVTRAGLVAIAVFVIIASIGVAVHLSVPQDNTAANDIYYCYAEGQNIVAGINPYLRILGGNMRENQKYPTYFPLFYFIAAASQKVGLTDYQQWLALFRWISLAFNVGTGSLLFYLLWRRKGLLLAIIGGLFWFLNRWNLQITQSANFSFLPVFFLILSLWFLPRHRLAALLLLSLSLSLKQVAVVLLPLYLIWIWQAAEEQPGRATTKGLAAALSVPVLLAIPFLVWPGASVFSNIEGFAKSILFSITRDPAAHVNAPSVDSLLGLTGPLARVPVFTLLALVYVAFARHKLGFYTASLLAIAVLLDFNPVLFVQYFCWLVPFILLVTTEIDTGRRPGVGAGGLAGGLAGGPAGVPTGDLRLVKRRPAHTGGERRGPQEFCLNACKSPTCFKARWGFLVSYGTVISSTGPIRPCVPPVRGCSTLRRPRT